ncbi:hypothetical protein ACN38_g2428 [Penicillium nordicum]|uniref:Uncharacterized protein n=1 Tax=Penicillium nordicum TaxID=229535 RepID=A0A0M8P7B4_9EURO|nr:hypothetical protein ACN38_g2428 [Penicillium nordicum]
MSETRGIPPPVQVYHNKLPPLASAEYVNKPVHLLESPEISISFFISYPYFFLVNTLQHYISMPNSDRLLSLSKGLGEKKVNPSCKAPATPKWKWTLTRAPHTSAPRANIYALATTVPAIGAQTSLDNSTMPKRRTEMITDRRPRSSPNDVARTTGHCPRKVLITEPMIAAPNAVKMGVAA